MADARSAAPTQAQPLAIAADHAGFSLKEQLKRTLAALGVPVADLGTDSERSVDYPDFAHAVARGVGDGTYAVGVLVCGTGIGMSIAANRHAGVRAALCTESYAAKMSRLHNDANVLCVGARIVGAGIAEEIVRAFLETRFEGGRHGARVAKIETDPPR